MHRILRTLVVLLAGLALPGFAQQERVQAKLYHRVEGGELQAAIEFRVEPGFHIYHPELGHKDAVGMPTKVALSAEGVEFEALVWPTPERHEQPEFGAWIQIHEGRFRVFGRAELGGEAAPETVAAKVSGQVCNAEGCTLFKFEELESQGAGSERIWEGFPTTSAPTESADEAPGEAELEDSTYGAQESDDEPSQLRGELYLRIDGGTARAVIQLDVEKGWHWYHHDLGNPKAIGQRGVAKLTGGGVEWGETTWPEPEKHTDVLGEWGFVHFGRVLLRAEGKVAGTFDAGSVRAEIGGQVCDEGTTCVQVEFTRASAGAGPDELFVPWPAAGEASGAQDGAPGGLVSLDEEDEDGGLLEFLIGAFLGGLFALLMPCTYPMIPITISFFTKQADARGGKVLSLSLLYGAGIVLMFILIGVLVGPVIIAFAQHPITNLVIGVAFLFFALVLFGVMELRPPQFLMAAAGKASMRGGYLGVFMMGATLVITSFTCTAPFVGALLGASAAGGALSLGEVALGMGVFGLTMAVPFVFLSLVPGRISAMPQSGEWMNTLKVTLGFVEVAAALKFLSNSDLVWEWEVLSREFFLLLWTGIFGVAAAYLFGWIKIKAEESATSSPGRLVGGLLFLVLSLYCWLGFRGYRMDKVMNSIVPPYSASFAVGTAPGDADSDGRGAPVAPKGHTIVKDDYQGARALAEREGKLLFVNFTGFT